MKDEKETCPLVDMVTIVAEVYVAVYQLYLRLWNDSGHIKGLWSQSVYRYVLQYIVDNAGRHDVDFERG